MIVDDTNIYKNVDDKIKDTIKKMSVWMESKKLAIKK